MLTLFLNPFIILSPCNRPPSPDNISHNAVLILLVQVHLLMPGSSCSSLSYVFNVLEILKTNTALFDIKEDIDTL